jgi:hypothetical protein
MVSAKSTRGRATKLEMFVEARNKFAGLFRNLQRSRPGAKALPTDNNNGRLCALVIAPRT